MKRRVSLPPSSTSVDQGREVEASPLPPNRHEEDQAITSQLLPSPNTNGAFIGFPSTQNLVLLMPEGELIHDTEVTPQQEKGKYTDSDW